MSRLSACVMDAHSGIDLVFWLSCHDPIHSFVSASRACKKNPRKYSDPRMVTARKNSHSEFMNLELRIFDENSKYLESVVPVDNCPLWHGFHMVRNLTVAFEPFHDWADWSAPSRMYRVALRPENSAIWSQRHTEPTAHLNWTLHQNLGSIIDWNMKNVIEAILLNSIMEWTMMFPVANTRTDWSLGNSSDGYLKSRKLTPAKCTQQYLYSDRRGPCARHIRQSPASRAHEVIHEWGVQWRRGYLTVCICTYIMCSTFFYIFI